MTSLTIQTRLSIVQYFRNDNTPCNLKKPKFKLISFHRYELDTMLKYASYSNGC